MPLSHRVAAAFAAFAALVLGSTSAIAATQRQIDAAVEKGTNFLKSQFKGGAQQDLEGHGIGPTALAGIALLEAKVPANDPAIQAIARAVRDTSYRETKTYQLSLCLLFLDKLENPADVPLIQVLAVRLLAGQNNQGGWTYSCINDVPQADERALRAGLKLEQLVAGRGKDGPMDGKDNRVGRLHPDVEKYAAALWARRQGNEGFGGDNSNTQFAILAVWAARKHGVPVESALNLIEKRFIASQDRQTGGWSYSGGETAGESTPAMTCAGLIGLSVGVARREEQRMKAEAARKEKAEPGQPKVNDPFFNPPTRPDAKKPAQPKRAVDVRNVPVQVGLRGLGAMFVAKVRGQGAFSSGEDLYFLWSLERVGVIYGVDKIGGLDWYAVGSDILVRSQGGAGSWSGGYGATIDTSFAILFLVRSNVARDLSSKVQKDPSNTELRSGPAPGTVEPEPGPAPLPATGGTASTKPSKPLPLPVADASGKMAAELLRAGGGDWTRVLERLRDSKGGDHTRALVLAIPRLEGEKKSQARGALAERLTRMTAETLRSMVKSEDAELRRGAVLACAMKDDRGHVADLIERLTDEEEFVVRAAVAGLKSLSRGRDFGPAAGATKEQKQAAADAWRAWWLKQK